MKIFKVMAMACLVAGVLPGCSKENLDGATDPSKTTAGFTEYIIPAGAQYSNNEGTVAVKTTEYKFEVYFDSSAIYTLPAADQHDINKLSGFADNAAIHLQYSARFGWRWSDTRLRLFGFVHNAGVIQEKEIGAIEIGRIYSCSIKVNGNTYVFNVDGLGSVTLPRAATTAAAEGYRLYPYFGGNNTAPHEIRLWLKYLP